MSWLVTWPFHCLIFSLAVVSWTHDGADGVNSDWSSSCPSCPRTLKGIIGSLTTEYSPAMWTQKEDESKEDAQWCVCFRPISPAFKWMEATFMEVFPHSGVARWSSISFVFGSEDETQTLSLCMLLLSYVREEGRSTAVAVQEREIGSCFHYGPTRLLSSHVDNNIPCTYYVSGLTEQAHKLGWNNGNDDKVSWGEKNHGQSNSVMRNWSHLKLWGYKNWTLGPFSMFYTSQLIIRFTNASIILRSVFTYRDDTFFDSYCALCIMGPSWVRSVRGWWDAGECPRFTVTKYCKQLKMIVFLLQLELYTLHTLCINIWNKKQPPFCI